MEQIKKWFSKPKKIEPKTARILITDNKWKSPGHDIVELIGLYLPRYKIEFKEVKDYDDWKSQYFHYTIEVSKQDKYLIERLLECVFRRNYGPTRMTLGEYERWLKIERIRRKVLDI